jgi:hypothetical protein
VRARLIGVVPLTRDELGRCGIESAALIRAPQR